MCQSFEKEKTEKVQQDFPTDILTQFSSRDVTGYNILAMRQFENDGVGKRPDLNKNYTFLRGTFTIFYTFLRGRC